MKRIFGVAAFAVSALGAAAPALADTFTLDFEGAPGYVNAIADHYNGGTDSLGHAGPNRGVSFTQAAVGLSNDAAFQYYSNAPSAGTVMFAFDATAVMNVAQGFVGGLSFYYAASQPVLDAVKIYSGLNGGGTLLASASLFGNAAIGCSGTAFCRFDLTSVQFAGVARSASFGGNAPNVVFDNITLTAVPEPQSWLLLGAGLPAVVAARRRRRAGQQLQRRLASPAHGCC